MHRHHPKHTTPAKSDPATPKKVQPDVASVGKEHAVRSVCADDIRLCAYRKWESAGAPDGDGILFWLEAEQELLHGV